VINRRKKPEIKAVLFDLDGTLLDTAPDFVTALNRMLIEKSMPPLASKIIRAGVTNGSAGLITMAFGLNPGDQEFEPLRQVFLSYYFECLTEQTRLFPGMELVLAKLQDRHIPWGIVTNKPEKYTRAILENLWLPSSPSTIVCPDHVRNTKPHPEPVLKACDVLEVGPQHTFFVGDHLRDIESGLSAGCITVSAAYGYIDNSDRPEHWGGHFLIHHASELDGILFNP
jgi:N-acetyl-D-muramate 6-phosphate phosphatase